jgi:F-type H+-transporting ATPase subunit gamma
MSGAIRDLRRRIRSVKSTQQITRAMKLVAASKLRKAQEAMEAARPYEAGIRDLLGNLTRRAGDVSHELMEQREGNKTLLLVVTSDRGLCGGFNGNVLKKAERILADSTREFSLELVGRKAIEFFGARGHDVRTVHGDVFKRLDFSATKLVTDSLIAGFLKDGFDEVQVLSNRFRSVMVQDVVCDTVLPAGAPDEGDAEGADDDSTDYIYEPSAEALLKAIVPRSIETMVHQALLESYAAEMGARMVAMEAATKNAGEMIDSLTLTMNRKRQAEITTEIIEVVSGAAAMTG